MMSTRKIQVRVSTPVHAIQKHTTEAAARAIPNQQFARTVQRVECMHSRLTWDARLIPEDDATKLRSRLSTGPKLLLDEQEEPLGGRAPSDVSFDPWR